MILRLSAPNRSVLIVALVIVLTDGASRERLNGQTPDIYDSINSLAESLRVWSSDTSSFQMNDRSFSEKVSHSLDLADLFPKSEVIWIDSLKAFQISLPRFMDLLETRLYLEVETDSSDQLSVRRWSVPIYQDGGAAIIDGQKVRVDSSLVGEKGIMDLIGQRLTVLRTLGLPPSLRPSEGVDNDISVQVLLRGRVNRSIDFSLRNWLGSLSKISAGQQIYAGLIDARLVNGFIELKYYVLINYFEAKGHHFLEWSERWEKGNGGWRTSGIYVTFVPYVRTDNLVNLFAQPKSRAPENFDFPLRR